MQIENSKNILNSMNPVCDIKVKEKYSSKNEAGDDIIRDLRQKGFKIERQNFGVINFMEKDIRSAIKYADTDGEKAAMHAIPYVLKRGIEAGEHKNHDNRQKRTKTFAAPVLLNGQRGNMAVVINLRGNNYYVSRIVNPDGSAFVFDKNKSEAKRELYKGVRTSASLANTTSFASEATITQTEPIVKSNLKENEKNSIEKQKVNSQSKFHSGNCGGS